MKFVSYLVSATVLMGLIGIGLLRLYGEHMGATPASAPAQDGKSPDTVQATMSGGNLESASGASRPDTAGNTGSVRFIVRDLQAVPMPGVAIKLIPEEEEESVARRESNADGQAVFRRLPAGSYIYRVRAPGGSPLASVESLELAAGEARVEELTLANHALTITGWVLDPDGAAVDGVQLTARAMRSSPEQGLVPVNPVSTRSGVDGGFELGGLRAGEYDIRAAPDERYSASRALVRADTRAVVIQLGRAADRIEFSGQVTTPGGKALPNVRVLPLGQPGSHGRTNTQGRYSLALSRPASGRQILKFLRDGYGAGEVVVDASELSQTEAITRDVVLDPLAAGVPLYGRVRDDRGAAVPGAVLYLASDELGTRYRASAETDGGFVFEDVPLGSSYRLWTRPPGPYAEFVREGIDPARGNLDIVLPSLAMGTLTGRVLDAQGAGVPHFTLSLRSAHTPSRSQAVVTDGLGAFRVAAPAGSLSLEARAEPRVQASSVELAPGSERYLELVLDLGGAELAGRVVDVAGLPVAGARLRLSSLDVSAPVARSLRTTVTDNGGEFRFTGVGGGEHKLRVHAPGIAGSAFTVPAGQSWVELTVDTGGRT